MSTRKLHPPKNLRYIKPGEWCLYFGTWLKVRAQLIDLAGWDPKEADAERHAIHIEALKVDKPSAEFTRQDVNRVLDALEKRLIVRDHTKAPRAVTQPRITLLHAIRDKGMTDDDIRALCKRCADAFGGRTDFENFSERELRTLRTQVTNIGRQNRRDKKKKAGTAPAATDAEIAAELRKAAEIKGTPVHHAIIAFDEHTPISVAQFFGLSAQ